MLHDIGLAKTEAGKERFEHGTTGADIATEFLKRNSNFSLERIEWIADAIRYHSTLPQTRAAHLSTLVTDVRLHQILCDADMLDALGALGLMKACTSKYYVREYDSGNIKGHGWGLSTTDFWARPGVKESGGARLEKTIIDQVNQQIRYLESLYTFTAK